MSWKKLAHDQRATTLQRQQEIEQRVPEAVAFRLNPVKWIGADGMTAYEVSSMSDAHILNTMQLLKNYSGTFVPKKRKGCNGLTNAQWYEIFRNELAARRFTGTYVRESHSTR